MTGRRLTEAETAPRMTNRDGETEERRTDLVGSASASRAESGSEVRGQYICNNLNKYKQVKQRIYLSRNQYFTKYHVFYFFQFYCKFFHSEKEKIL